MPTLQSTYLLQCTSSKFVANSRRQNSKLLNQRALNSNIFIYLHIFLAVIHKDKHIGKVHMYSYSYKNIHTYIYLTRVSEAARACVWMRRMAHKFKSFSLPYMYINNIYLYIQWKEMFIQNPLNGERWICFRL